MFGNTTKCVEAARTILEADGFEVLVFHAVGVGGQTTEGLIEAGQVSGVLDVTLTEWADELAGGVMPAGPTRLEAAARSGTPAVIAPGCLDMVNFWGPETIPSTCARAGCISTTRTPGSCAPIRTRARSSGRLSPAN